MAGGEISVFSGEEGQKLVTNFLKMVGWNVAGHIQYECVNGERHKSDKAKGERQTHNIDALFQYDSPLNHNDKEIVFVSIKHHKDKYVGAISSYFDDFLRDIGQSLQCAPFSGRLVDEGFVLETSKQKKYVGIIFWLSSNSDESERDLILELHSQISVPRLINFDTVYVVDNRKATFIFSAVETARSYRSTAKLKFFYHHTGLNLNADELIIAGDILPIELMNSSLLPIVLEDKTKTSLLLFCNSPFDKDYLKRLIWFAHKISGLSNEIVIYFTDYESTAHSRQIDAIKQGFQDKDVIEKITIRKFDNLSFTRLKEDKIDRNVKEIAFKPKKIAKDTNKKDDTIDKILPFGEMIKPVLSSSQLSDTDLKHFLLRKGIILKSSEKEATVPVFANMLLAPSELDELRNMLKEKEDKEKSVNRTAKWKNVSVNLDSAVQQLGDIFSSITPPINSKMIERPTLKRIRDNYYEVPIKLERTNTTKDLMSGTSQHDATVGFILEGQKLSIKLVYTSTETKKVIDKIVVQTNKKLAELELTSGEANKIVFGDFNNESRIDFLLSFSDVINDTFSNGKLENIKFKPDDTKENLPEDLEPMKGRVSNLSINGSGLNALNYVKKIEYKRCVLLEKVVVKFDFNHAGNIGTCTAEIGFPSTLNNKIIDEQTELQTILDIKAAKKGTKFILSINALHKQLSKKLDEIVSARIVKIENSYA